MQTGKRSADELPSTVTPGSKRPCTDVSTRLDETTSVPRTSPQYLHVQKDDDLWFDDGNIVLIAEGTGFRVHGSFLARRASIFADMLAFSQPDMSVDVFEDAPAIVLMDDPNHLATFLRAIYDGRYVFNVYLKYT